MMKIMPIRKIANLFQKVFNLKKNNVFPSITSEEKFIRVEIRVEKMMSLFIKHQIRAEDLHCLDINSKQILQKICLKNCFSQTYVKNKKSVITIFPLYSKQTNLGEST